MSNELTTRRVIKLRHILENMVDQSIPNWAEKEEQTKDKIYHFRSGKAYIDLMERTLAKPLNQLAVNTTLDMSDKTLDLENVIIPPQVSYTLETYIRQYGLNVIDTTMERPETFFNSQTNQYEQKEAEHMSFRHDYFQELFREIQLTKSALPVEKLMYEDNGALVFRYKHAVPLILDIIKERQQQGNDNRLLINISRINSNDLESCKELAYVILKLNEFVEVTNSSALSHASIYGLLPCVAQMCIDFTDTKETWMKFKKSVKVGDTLYISTTPNVYRLVNVVENITETKDGRTAGDTLTDEEKELIFSIKLKGIAEEEDEEGTLDMDRPNTDSDENDKQEVNPLEPQQKEIVALDFNNVEFSILSKEVIQKEVLIFPTAVFEGGDSVLMPTPEEIDFRYKNTEFTERKSLTRNPFEESLYSDSATIDVEFNWIKEYQKAEEARYSKNGMKIPKLDLERIILGEESPFKGNMP